jgi:hypothetical protein
MLPRALIPIALCAAAMWPLHALACMNSMDASAINFTQTLWVDLPIWAVGAVFLNRVVIGNVWSPAVEGQPKPSWFRRSFFLLVGASVILVLATASAAGPLLNLTSLDLGRCAMKRDMVLMLLISPTVLFVLQALLFRRIGKRLFGDDKVVAIVSLVVTSALLVLVVGVARDNLFLPNLCSTHYSVMGGEHSGYDPSAY